MFDLTLIRYITELLGKHLTFPDIEMIGCYIFKNYSTHRLGKVSNSITISPLTAASLLVEECRDKGKLGDLFVFVIELDGTLLNGKTVKFGQLENLLYRLSTQGYYFDFNKRRLIKYDQERTLLKNWGALKDGKEYQMIIASIDVCDNSSLVKKYKPKTMEKVYYSLWEFIQSRINNYNGRVWTWAGDGGIIAFRYNDGAESAVACCLDILFSLPVFNALKKHIEEDMCLRLGMDSGPVKFFHDTGRIVSDVINHASHLEKRGTEPNGLSVTSELFETLPPAMQKLFPDKTEFEGRDAHSLVHRFENSIA
jgi:class 3 adenylate cyclase